ncbi:GntR family transcriptional regulator [Brevibacillus sp. SYSU BS000544]|uniref:GntR family transcriptional regulator n=1 Tax=Brevibacillus sp. SYSU BS000544 TaxID=3416443 RepID=UPI003CE5B7D0
MIEQVRSSDLVEHEMISKILAGEYPPASTLPAERELAVAFGIGRPTIREALQRLERDGWITIRKGHPAIVTDYWKKGNLQTLAAIARHTKEVSDDLIIYLLELRLSLSTTFVADAVKQNPAKVVSFLACIEELSDEASDYATFDWQLQTNLAGLSKNPLYLLLINSFECMYQTMALRYFFYEENRSHSLSYYRRLLQTAMQCNYEEAKTVTWTAMKESMDQWKKRKASHEEE